MLNHNKSEKSSFIVFYSIKKPLGRMHYGGHIKRQWQSRI